MSSNKRAEILRYIRGFQREGYSLHWGENKKGMVMVYIFDFKNKLVMVEAPLGVLGDLRREVEGN